MGCGRRESVRDKAQGMRRKGTKRTKVRIRDAINHGKRCRQTQRARRLISVAPLNTPPSPGDPIASFLPTISNIYNWSFRNFCSGRRDCAARGGGELEKWRVVGGLLMERAARSRCYCDEGLEGGGQNRRLLCFGGRGGVRETCAGSFSRLPTRARDRPPWEDAFHGDLLTVHS